MNLRNGWSWLMTSMKSPPDADWVSDDLDEELGNPLPPARKWNDDKPHRCPVCHAIAIDATPARRLLTWSMVTCCRCGARFTRWPILDGFVRERGVVCSEHREA